MSTDPWSYTSEAAVRDFISAFNDNRLDGLAEDYVEHDRADPVDSRQLNDIETRMDQLDGSLSDLPIGIEDTVAEGDRVAVNATASAVHEGDFYGVPPTGERIEWAHTVIARVEEGLVVAAWPLRDDFRTRKQPVITASFGKESVEDFAYGRVGLTI